MDSMDFPKPMLNTRGRHWYWSRGDDGGWCSRKLARLEASREANKMMLTQAQEWAPVRDRIREIALTPLDTLLGK